MLVAVDFVCLVDSFTLKRFFDMFLCQFEPENYNLNIDVAFLELYVKLSYEGTNIFSFHTWIDSSNLRMKKASERRNNFPLTYFFQSALPEFSSWEGSLDPCLSVLCTHCYTTSIFIPFKHTVHLGGHSKDVRLKNGLCHSSMSLTSPFFSLKPTGIGKHSMPALHK